MVIISGQWIWRHTAIQYWIMNTIRVLGTRSSSMVIPFIIKVSSLKTTMITMILELPDEASSIARVLSNLVYEIVLSCKYLSRPLSPSLHLPLFHFVRILLHSPELP